MKTFLVDQHYQSHQTLEIEKKKVNIISHTKHNLTINHTNVMLHTIIFATFLIEVESLSFTDSHLNLLLMSLFDLQRTTSQQL